MRKNELLNKVLSELSATDNFSYQSYRDKSNNLYKIYVYKCNLVYLDFEITANNNKVFIDMLLKDGQSIRFTYPLNDTTDNFFIVLMVKLKVLFERYADVQ
jgi:hypothetical protein